MPSLRDGRHPCSVALGPAERTQANVGTVQVVEMLRGNAALPWEGALSTQHAHQLGVLKGPVMQLLQRDAAARPPLRAFHSACSSLFSSSPALVA